MTSWNRPEVDLLLRCARSRIEGENAQRIRNLLLEREIDWAYLVETATRQGVAPLLFRSLHSTCPDAVPPAVLAHLRSQFYSNAFRNVLLTRELLELLELLEKNHVPAVPCKGPVLAALLYGNVAARSFSDLDVLVRKRDLGKVRDLLVAAGYRPQDQVSGEGQEELLLETGYEFSFSKEDGGGYVEIHWALAPEKHGFFPDPAGLWQRLEPVRFAGRTVLSPAPEDQMLILCLHLGAHMARRAEALKWACDVAECVNTYPDMDWPKLMERAASSGATPILFVVLHLVRELMQVEIPEGIRRKMQDEPRTKKLSLEVCERIFSGTARPPIPPLFHMRLLPGLKQRIGYGRRYFRRYLAPNEEDEKFLVLPFFSDFKLFYYCIRPVRLVRRYGFGPFADVVKGFLGF